MHAVDCLKTKYQAGVRLRGDVYLQAHETTVEVRGKNSFTLNKLRPEDVSFIHELKAGISPTRMTQELTPRQTHIISLLETRQVLRHHAPPHDDPRQSRQVDWLSYFKESPKETNLALAQKHVAIIGCGGTGAAVATHLVRAGVKKLTLIDPASIDAPDLNRQLNYFPADIAKLKVTCLAADLLRLDPGLELAVLPQAVTDASWYTWLSTTPDLAIGAADKPIGLIQAWLAEGSRDGNFPIIFGGVGLEDASIGPLLLDANAKQRFADVMRRAHHNFGVDEQTLAASICFTNTMAAALIAFEAFKYLSGILPPQSLHRSLVVDFLTYSSKEESVW